MILRLRRVANKQHFPLCPNAIPRRVFISYDPISYETKKSRDIPGFRLQTNYKYKIFLFIVEYLSPLLQYLSDYENKQRSFLYIKQAGRIRIMAVPTLINAFIQSVLISNSDDTASGTIKISGI